MVCSKPCHGLNLVSTAQEDYLYNPCTGYYKTHSYPGSLIRTPWESPSDGPSIQDSAFSAGNKNIGLGFNPLIQEHISIIILYQHKDFGSREYQLTCSLWHCSSGHLRRISAPPLPVNDMPPAYVAGVFYWMSDPLLGPSNEQAVVAFDIVRHQFDVIPSPSHIAKWCSNMLGQVPPYGGVLAAQHQPKKSNTYQPLIEVRIQRLRCLLRGNKKKTLATLGGCVSKKVSEAKNVAAAERE